MRMCLKLSHGFLFPEEREYVGSTTCWHDAASGRRAPSHIEARLADAYAALHPSPHEVEITAQTGVWPFRKERTFVGHGTIWRDKATGRRVGTLLEERLSTHPRAFPRRRH